MATPLAGYFEEPKQEVTTMDKVAAALGGFGAGFRGKGQEYAQGVRDQRQSLDLERQKAMAQDAMQVYNMLGTGKYDDAIGLIDRRVKAISELGGDPSDTLQIRQMITSGQIPEATQELEGFLGQAMQYGLIEPPPAPEVVSGSNIINGQIVERDATGVRARRVEGLELAPEQQSELARKFVQQIMPDGTFRTLQTDQRGNFFDPSGKAVQLEPDANLVEGTMMQGTPEDFNTTSAEFRQLRDKESATRSVIATVGDMIGMLQENPNINTIVSSAASFANNLAAEARALGNAMGMREEVDRLINPDTFSSTFNELGIRNRQMQSLVSNLAYTVARSNDPGGRLSDVDVRRAIVEIGGSSSDPVAFARVLNDVARRAERNFQIDYRTRTGGEYRGGLGSDQLPQFTEGEPGESPQIAAPMTIEEYNALPSGAIYVDPDDGKQYRKP